MVSIENPVRRESLKRVVAPQIAERAIRETERGEA
jgi:hypothetical protein